MTALPLISVVIPSRNRCASLRRCIETVKAQTYKETEILVINDCSDEPYDGIEDLGVRYFETDRHGGSALARNVGLQNARGEFIAFLDDDDGWLPTKLEVQLADMARRGATFSSTEAYRVIDKSNVLASPVYHRVYHRDFMMKHLGTVELPSEFDLPFIESHNYIITSAVIIHRSWCEHVGLFNESDEYRRGQDYEYWKRVLRAGAICHYLDIPFTFYRAF